VGKTQHAMQLGALKRTQARQPINQIEKKGRKLKRRVQTAKHKRHKTGEYELERPLTSEIVYLQQLLLAVSM